MKVVAIVGLRSGSKGIKDKNIKNFINKPLFFWVLNTLRQSKYIERIIVSTDSEKYRKLVQQNGFEAPFLRPKKISSDSSTDLEYIKHAVKYLEKKENYFSDIIVRTLVTVPLQKVEDIDNAIKKLIKSKNATSCTIVKESPYHPLKMYKIKYGILKSYIGEKDKTDPEPRQKFKKAYIRCNTIVFKRKNLDKKSITGEKNLAVLASSKIVDIDNEEDFILNEILQKKGY